MNRRVLTAAAVVLLLGALAAQTLLAARTKSPTCDEFAHHLANGYSYLMTRDFRMNPASPPLSRMVPAIPLVFMGAKLPLDHPSWAQGDTIEFAKQFFYHTNGDCTTRYVYWSRVPVVLLSMVFAFLVFLAARVLLGTLGGVLTLFFYVFSPNLLAHSGLATADLMVAFFFFLSLAALWAYLTRPSVVRLVLIGVFTGGAFLSKYSALVLPPILFLVTLAAGHIGRFNLRRYFVMGAAALLTIWAGYFFEVKPLLENTPDPAKKEAMYRKVGGEALKQFAEKVPVPLSTFTSSIVSMGVTRYKGRDAFLLGEWSYDGWWYYYFVALAIKETVPFLLLALAGILLIRKWGWNRLTTMVVLVPIAAFFVFTLRDKAQAGIRYFLPIFPSLLVLAGGAAAWLWRRKHPAAKALCAALLSWHAGAALTIFPDHLAYFNELIGGPANGYKYLRDSNIDWCQDLKGVGEWSVRQGYPEVVLMYHGVEDPAYYGIPHRPFEREEFVHPRSTVYAVGAHHIDTAEWALKVPPAHVVGWSFYIYDFRNGIPEEIQ